DGLRFPLAGRKDAIPEHQNDRLGSFRSGPAAAHDHYKDVRSVPKSLPHCLRNSLPSCPYATLIGSITYEQTGILVVPRRSSLFRRHEWQPSVKECLVNASD